MASAPERRLVTSFGDQGAEPVLVSVRPQVGKQIGRGGWGLMVGVYCGGVDS